VSIRTQFKFVSWNGSYSIPEIQSSSQVQFLIPLQAVEGGVEDAVDTVASPPELISQAPGLRLWHNLDHTFRVPRANAYFLLTSAATYDSPRSAALTHLTLKLLEVRTSDIRQSLVLSGRM